MPQRQVGALGADTVMSNDVNNNDVNNIVRQANQGSVAAIIQVLNEKLADAGVRTRAVFEDGVLQLLCEAPTPDELESSPLIEQIRQTLEAIAPRNVRRVKINSRLVREQQLLWLEEINRHPEKLLWSQEITLRQPNLLQRWLRDWQTNADQSTKLSFPTISNRKVKEQRHFWRGLLGGTGLSLLLLGGWLVYSRINGSNALVQGISPTANVLSPVPSPAGEAAKPSTPKADDAFVNAVRIAEQASQDGVTARSLAQWLELAARWQKASDLMAQVPENDPRYKTAQDRTVTYQRNRELALEYARKLQPESQSEQAAPETAPPDSPPASPQ